MVGPIIVKDAITDIGLGKNNVEGTTEIENLVDEGDSLDKGTTKVEIVVDEGGIVNKGTNDAKTLWMKKTL